MIIANGDAENIRKMNISKDISYFGLNNNNNIVANNIEYSKDGITFDLVINQEKYKTFQLPIYGEHQLMDALAVISVCYYENINLDEVEKQFQTFTGAKRRFTETFVKNNIIIDDYAHHPNEIKSTINAIKQKYPDKLVISIFQPHTFTRTEEFAKDIAKELSKTDFAYIMDIHPAREKQEDYPHITKNIIIEKMNNGYGLKMNDAVILDKHKDAVFIFM